MRYWLYDELHKTYVKVNQHATTDLHSEHVISTNSRKPFRAMNLDEVNSFMRQAALDLANADNAVEAKYKVPESKL